MQGWPAGLRRRIEFFASHFELFEPGARQLEYMTKDTVKLSGIDLASLAGEGTGKDALAELGSQTKNGLSVRALMTCLVYAKALAWFRAGSKAEVTVQDLRQLVPFALHEKLVPNAAGDFFASDANRPLVHDKIAWIRRMFDMTLGTYDQLGRDDKDDVARLADELETEGLEGVKASVIDKRMNKVAAEIRRLVRQGELAPYVYEDLVRLKAVYMRYQNQLNWLRGSDG